MKRGIVIQARMSSTRLPGKVLRRLQGRTLLELCAIRAARSQRADVTVIATTNAPDDDAIVAEAQRLGFPSVRGSEQDVLSRYHLAAGQHKLDVICRVTSDCPLIDPELIDSLFDLFSDGPYDYVSNSLTRTFPRGLDAEVFSLEALDTAHRLARSGPEREHVTLFLYRNPALFRLGGLESPTDLSNHRWTVDEADDLSLVEAILERMPLPAAEFSYRDVLGILEREPDLRRINAHVTQKET